MNRATQGSASSGEPSFQQARGHVDNPSAALQGASTAFNAYSSKKPVREPPNRTNGAAQAAFLAERANRLPPVSSRRSSSESLPPEARSLKQKIGMFMENPIPPSARNVLDNRTMTSSPRSQTPQQIAAQIAAGRSSSRTPIDNGSTRTNSPDRNELPTSVSIQNGENGSYNKPQATSGGAREANGLLAPKPVRKLSSKNTAIGNVLSASDDSWNGHEAQISPSSKSPGPQMSADSAMPIRLVPPERPNSTAADPVKLTPTDRGPVQKSVNSSQTGRRNSKEHTTVPPSNNLPSASLPDEQKPKLPPRRSIAAVNGPSRGPQTDLHDTSRGIPRGYTPGFESPGLSHLAPSPSNTSAPFRPRANSTISHNNNSGSSVLDDTIGIDEDSLSDAMVASSLASSHAPAPMEIPPPLPHRRQRSRSLLHPKGDNHRTPSPPKGLRQTLRDHPKPDNEGENNKRHGKMRIIKKHPHKHHEGDRKRWRNEITERERKRYEGVWAANKGLWVPTDRSLLPSPIQEPNSTTHPQDPSEMVVNVVVRDIWSRSRLPPTVLEKIWDLVDRQGIGMLTRDEFVVGMWLIDQQLKGRKLPFKVPDSVWESVKHVSGIKLPGQKA